jgi:hypothetical protein
MDNGRWLRRRFEGDKSSLHSAHFPIIAKSITMQEVLAVSEIRSTYPDQWVLVGNPEIEVATLKSGFVIANAKDKRDLVELGQHWRERFHSTTTYFTGPRPLN